MVLLHKPAKITGKMAIVRLCFHVEFRYNVAQCFFLLKKERILTIFYMNEKYWHSGKIFESQSHREMVKEFNRVLKNNGYETILYGLYNGKRPNILVLKNQKIVGVVECLHTKTIKAAAEKLLEFPGDIDRYIVRWRKNRNPKARTIIKDIESRGIKFVEL